MSGLKGENVVDDTVWIVKTHSPLYDVENLSFGANKVVLVVRNPLDSMISFLNFVSVMTHA